MSKLRSVGRWLVRHWFLTLCGLLLAILVLMPVVRTIASSITLYHAKNCGSLPTFGWRTPDGSRLGPPDIRCFVQAHQQCEAATLFQSDQGTESAALVTFRTANRLGGCVLSVIGYVEGFCVFPLCHVAPFIDAECRAMQQEQDGLHFLNCGDVPDTSFTV